MGLSAMWKSGCGCSKLSRRNATNTVGTAPVTSGTGLLSSREEQLLIRDSKLRVC